MRLVDASFIWTEPHSRRLKMKLTIQKEVFANTILQQAFQVESIVASMMCNDCMRVMAQNTWRAVVQVRQKLTHKRTFLYLEQLILKHGAHSDTVNIKECKDGIDFFYAQKQHALQMVSFLQSVVPCRMNSSQQLISTDARSNVANYRFTFSVELIPICKDDLIVLPLPLAASSGNISPLVLCSRVRGGGLSLLDPRTLQHTELQNTVYWRTPFQALCESSSNLNTFYVLQVEPLGPADGRLALCDVTVARCHAPANAGPKPQLQDLDIDFERTFITRSHLGHILKEGDYVLGYTLGSANFNSELLDNLMRRNQYELPDVVLVRKAYDKSKKRRVWKVKRLADGMQVDADEETTRKGEQQRREEDWEGFLEEVERDREMRAMINLYRDPTVNVDPASMASQPESEGVDLAELMEEMQIDDGPDYPQ